MNNLIVVPVVVAFVIAIVVLVSIIKSQNKHFDALTVDLVNAQSERLQAVTIELSTGLVLAKTQEQLDATELALSLTQELLALVESNSKIELQNQIEKIEVVHGKLNVLQGSLVDSNVAKAIKAIMATI